MLTNNESSRYEFWSFVIGGLFVSVALFLFNNGYELSFFSRIEKIDTTILLFSSCIYLFTLILFFHRKTFENFFLSLIFFFPSAFSLLRIIYVHYLYPIPSAPVKMTVFLHLLESMAVFLSLLGVCFADDEYEVKRWHLFLLFSGMGIVSLGYAKVAIVLRGISADINLSKIIFPIILLLELMVLSGLVMLIIRASKREYKTFPYLHFGVLIFFSVSIALYYLSFKVYGFFIYGAVSFYLFLFYALMEVVKKYFSGSFSEGINKRLINEYKKELETYKKKVFDLERQKRNIRERTIETQESARLKSELLANMSHELRTPMNSIIGFTTRVIRKTEGIIPERQLKNLKTVERNAYHLLGLINTILDISKLEAGRMEVFLEKFSVNDLVSEVMDMTRSLVEKKDIKLTSDVEDGVILNSDRTKIKQMLINLVGNAVKFTERGEIKITAENVSAGNGLKVDSVRISVSDTGIGIKEEDIPYIFDDYKQVDGSLVRKTGGTGLGLALVKRFTHLLGGKVEVESKYEVGTTFTLILPLNSKGLIVSQEEKKKRYEKNNLLFCCPNEAIAAKYNADFEMIDGVHAYTSTNIESAFLLAKETYPRLVVVDIFDQNIVWLKLMKKIKENYYTKHLQFASVSFIKEDEVCFLQFPGIIYKPLNKEVISGILDVAYQKNGDLKNILIFDNDEANLELARKLLLSEGEFSIRTTSFWGDAVKLAEMQKPDICIVNLFIPEGEAFLFLKEIGTNKNFIQVSCFLMLSKIVEAGAFYESMESKVFYLPKRGIKYKTAVAELFHIADRMN